MKKMRHLLLAVVMVLMLAMLTGCGVENPTEADVKKVLEKVGAIPTDDEDADKDDEDSDKDDADKDDEKEEVKDSYTVKIDKVKLNDDKDRADVDATLTIKTALVTYEEEYEIRFRLNDDKEWNVKKSRLEDDVECVGKKLTEGIPEEELKKVLKNAYSFTFGEGKRIEGSAIADSMSIKEHKLSEEEMEDVVTIEGTVEQDITKYSYKMDVAVVYYDTYAYWGLNTYELVSCDISYTQDGIADSDLLKYLEDGCCSFYVSDSYGNSSALKDVKVVNHTPDLANYKDVVRISATFTKGVKVYAFEANVNCSYSTYSEKWNADRMEVDNNSVEETFTEAYNVTIDEKFLVDLLKNNEDLSVNFLSYTYKTAEQKLAIDGIRPNEDKDLTSFEGLLTGSTRVDIETVVTFTLAGKLTVDVAAPLRLYFDESEGWSVTVAYGSQFLTMNGVIEGTWNGTRADGSKVTVIMPTVLENGSVSATVTIDGVDGEQKIGIYGFDPDTNEIDASYNYNINLDGTLNVETMEWTLSDGTVLTKAVEA